MPARQTVRKIAIWTCLAIPVLAGMYFGAYHRMVAQMRVITISGPNPAPMLKVQPTYFLPWPIPSQYNQPAVQSTLAMAFAPAHELDQWLRPTLWTETAVSIQVNSTAGGNTAFIVTQ